MAAKLTSDANNAVVEGVEENGVVRTSMARVLAALPLNQRSVALG